ncbi:hypothetical protein [Streptomyces canus]|uniref:hypothetical protein n=1 Tax=Streptomyces canus TaxID=58343 RepID=UPI00036FB97E|nr:hypothetical protein [Streptomyces canus]
MPYVYRCRTCRAASRPQPTRADAEACRQQHRDDEHGGLVPAGEAIERVPGSTRDPDGRYVDTRVLLIGLVLLILAEAVVRLFT